MKYRLILAALCCMLTLSSCFDIDKVYPFSEGETGRMDWATEADSAPPISIPYQYHPWRMLGGYYTTWISVNGAMFGTSCDSMKWDSTGHSLFSRLRIWDGSFTTYYNLHGHWMKPFPFYNDWHKDVFTAYPILKEFATTSEPFAVEGRRSIDTLFLFRGTYPMYSWDSLQVQAVDTFIISH